MSQPALRAQALEKRFGRAAALRGIDLEVAEGDTLAVLGPNGAGKSTLLRLAAGLSRPSGGCLELAGLPATQPGARARVGYVGHATLLYAALTARENLVFAARLHGVAQPAARAEALLVEMGLAHAADRATGGFSRGMAQRLAIARGLVHEPPLVLLDEPFTGLDGPAADRLAARLRSLRGGGRTLLLVTHDVERAVTLADRAVVLTRGRIALETREPAAERAAIERAYAAAEASAA